MMLSGKSGAVSITFIVVTLLFVMVKGEMKQPCKFGDKIEYGKLGEEVQLPGGLDAYVSHPKNVTSKGGVVVIQDIYGWTLSNTRAIVDMLMDNGFTAILPDSFEGKAAWNRSRPRSEFSEFRRQRPSSGIDHVITASIEYLRNEYAITNFGMVGFCWGGGAAHYAMVTRNDISAAVACYGLVDARDPRFGEINGPTLFIFGGSDRLIPNRNIIKLRKSLRNNTIKFAIRKYAGQTHGFVHRKLPTADDPNKDMIYKARRKMIRWLKRFISSKAPRAFRHAIVIVVNSPGLDAGESVSGYILNKMPSIHFYVLYYIFSGR